jgi:hypothetical protein
MKVGTGFSNNMLNEWRARLEPLAASPPAELLVAGDPLARLSQLAPNNPPGGRFPVAGSCKVGTTGTGVIAISECHPA